MGIFDFFKSPEEKLKEETYKTIFDEAFPGGFQQLENELKEISRILNYKYPIDEIRKVYMTSTQTYFLTRDKTDENIVLSILTADKNKFQKVDAIKISTFLRRKLDGYSKAKSLVLLSSKLNCKPSEVKQTYLDLLKEQGVQLSELQELIKSYRAQNDANALSLNMAIENTPSALFEIWTQEYLESLKEDEEEPFLDPVKEFIFKKVFNNQPQTFDSIMEHFAYEEDPAEYFRLEAIDKMFDEKDYSGAIVLIDKGLAINDKEKEAYLFKLRAECNSLLDDNQQSLIDIEDSIKSFYVNDPEDVRGIKDCLKMKGEIELKLGKKNQKLKPSLSAGKPYEELSHNDFFAKHNIISIGDKLNQTVDGTGKREFFIQVYTATGESYNILFSKAASTTLEKLGKDFLIESDFFTRFKFMWSKSPNLSDGYDWKIFPKEYNRPSPIALIDIELP